DIWSWSVFDEEKQIAFNGHYLVHGEEAVLIDPPDPDPATLDDLRRLMQTQQACPLQAILLTNLHHDRGGPRLRDVFSIPLHMPEADAALADFQPDKVFRGVYRSFCGLRVVHVPCQKTPGESVFHLEDRKILIVGDALIGRVQGKVNLLPPDKYADIHKAKAGLRVLGDLDFEMLLVGDGFSILREARQAVGELIEF
ncbi:MAG: hypothetical protein ACE5ER_12045, partial [Nitrospinaceae bacterium]